MQAILDEFSQKYTRKTTQTNFYKHFSRKNDKKKNNKDTFI